eukprot:4776157-Amphidinium_carterae.3
MLTGKVLGYLYRAKIRFCAFLVTGAENCLSYNPFGVGERHSDTAFSLRPGSDKRIACSILGPLKVWMIPPSVSPLADGSWLWAGNSEVSR